MANSHSGFDYIAALQNDNTAANEAFSNPQSPILITEPTAVGGGDFVLDSSDNQNLQIFIPDTVSAAPNVPALAVSDSHSSIRYPLNPGNEDLTKKKCVGRGNRALTVGECLHQGIRSSMEDFVAVVQGFMELSCEEFGGCTTPFCEYASKKSPIHFFGVFDGHGGDQVSKLCANMLPDMVKEEWVRCSEEDGWKKRWEVALCRAYQRMDDIFKDRSIAPYSVGSTALVVILSACRIVAANCGDSRAVLARGTRPICLTVDHRELSGKDLGYINFSWRKGGKEEVGMVGLVVYQYCDGKDAPYGCHVSNEMTCKLTWSQSQTSQPTRGDDQELPSKTETNKSLGPPSSIMRTRCQGTRRSGSTCPGRPWQVISCLSRNSSIIGRADSGSEVSHRPVLHAIRQLRSREIVTNRVSGSSCLRK